MGKFSSYPTDSSPTTDDYVLSVDAGVTSNRKVLLSSLVSLFITSFTANQIMTALAALTAMAHNLVINGNFDIWQRNTTFTPNDDTYGPDRWNLLTETNGAWTFLRDTDVPAGGGSHYSMRVQNVTLNNQSGIVTILEGKDAMQLAGETVSLSFQAKTNGTEIANLRAAILSWTGTEDAVTSDVIGTWAQNGTNPTWAANWTMENGPTNLALTSIWQRFTIENVALDTASLKNIAIVVWVDDGTIAAGDDWYITQVQLNVGIKALPFQPAFVEQQLALCKRYYQKSYPLATVPGTADGYTEHIGMCFADTTSDAHGTNRFITEMRTTPTVTVYAFDGASGSGTAARVRDDTAGGLKTVTATSIIAGMGISDVSSAAAFTAGRAYGFNYTADAEL